MNTTSFQSIFWWVASARLNALQSVAVRRTSSEKFAQRQPADIALALIDNQPADDNLIDKDESSDNEASEISTDLEDYEWDFPLNEDISNDNGFM